MRISAGLLAIALLVTSGATAPADTFAGRSYHLSGNRTSEAAAPLVILLHGMGGTGRHLRRTSGFDDFAAPRGIVAAYPSAPESRWNDGRWDAIGRPDLAARDDVGWLAGLIADLARRGIADPSQVYVLGHSNGGGMAMRIACERPGLIAGIAVVSTKMLTAAPCLSDTPVPAIFFYGTADRIAPHEGRDESKGTIFDKPLGSTLSAAETIAFWQTRNRCGAAMPAQVSDPDPTDDVTLSVTDWAGCAAPLRYVEMIGGGHMFPGAAGLRPGIASLLGDPIRDVNAGDAALAFWFGN